VLGYDVDPRGGRLIVNDGEAQRVRGIFAIAARSGTLTSALREIDERELTTKAWTSQGGRLHGEIAGTYYDTSGVSHGYLLTP
jgi:site-specific DNA recombinase